MALNEKDEGEIPGVIAERRSGSVGGHPFVSRSRLSTRAIWRADLLDARAWPGSRTHGPGLVPSPGGRRLPPVRKTIVPCNWEVWLAFEWRLRCRSCRS